MSGSDPGGGRGADPGGPRDARSRGSGAGPGPPPGDGGRVAPADRGEPTLAGPPTGRVRIPAAVRAIAGARAVVPVWRNEAGGLTFELAGAGGDRLFVKWAPAGGRWRLDAERPRLAWAGGFTEVPEVVDGGHDADGAWLVTRALPGTNAVTGRWRRRPELAVPAVAEGLRRWHDGLPVEACPFAWSAEDRVDAARRTAGLDPGRWHAEHRHLSVGEALERIAAVPPIDRAVVCHGDACAPNTLLDDDGRCCGHVDVGRLGVGDRWADLAVASWSAEWNYGPGWGEVLVEAYGVAPDPVRSAYYRLLWDLT